MRLASVAALALLAAAPLSARGADDPLAKRLDGALSHRALRGARVGALVVAADDGRVLFAREPDRALVPASNQKVLTAIAAFETFGPTHRFVTEFLSVPAPRADGSVDVLAIRAGGDPAITSEELWRIAADLRRRGLRHVKKGIRIDVSMFDAKPWHPEWGAVSARAYHAPIGAFAANYGAYAVAVTPGAKSGDPVHAVIDPAVDYLRLVNRAVTSPPRGRRGLEIGRSVAPGREEVRVTGSARSGADTKVYYRSVSDPARYAASLLRMQLEAVGIRVEGGVELGPLPADAVPLFEHEGKALAETTRLFMKYSNNSIGESLVKAMGAHASGAPGSWANGIPALLAALDRAGVETSALTVVDGSGLSYGNRVSARVLVGALRLATDSFRYGPEFVSSLPIANGDGTLKDRAKGAAWAVRAKTGLLTRVTALSGYARRSDGTDVVFSVLANGFRGSADSAMSALDGFVAGLVK